MTLFFFVVNLPLELASVVTEDVELLRPTNSNKIKITIVWFKWYLIATASFF